MGTTTSAQQGPGQELQGDHYSQLLYPATASSHKQGRRSAGQGGEDAAASGAGAGTGGCVLLAPRASVLKNLSWESLWQNFLDGSASSFALTPAEATALLLASAAAPDSDAGTTGQGKLGTTALEKDVKNYITLVGELSEKDIGSSIDFMAVCSSVLLLGEDTIESKADQLYSWIVLRHVEEFNYEEFVVAMASFDRGVSHALGKPACSEAFIRSVATQWMALADPKHKGSTDALTRISASNFFDFCTNRQHVVRRMLEALSTSQIVSDNNLEVQEVTETVDLLEEPSGGDEWMANPAWKKTAQLMLPSGVTFPDVKPSSTLELEWVHGYRGFDCRNNVRYADKEGKQIIFSAAALGIAQDNSGSSATQSYFAEHGDDIISLATVTTSSNTTLVATGEIGKAPAVYLYEWMPGAQSGGQFVSLSCLRGYHTKGVAQLCFSIAGDVVFSVGVDYTVAIYGTESGKASFGKMVASSQGPKGKVLHCIAYGASGNMFLSCGEKHAVCWTIDKGVLKQETCKLGTHKNKMLMAAARGASGVAIIATSDGELLVLKDNTVMPNITDGQHSKKSINALWSNSEGTVLVSGGRDGKINLWRVTSSGPSVSINLLTCFSLTKFSSSVPLLGVEVADPAPTSNKTGKESNRRGNKKSDSKQKSASIPISSSESDSSVPPVRSVCLSVDGKKVLVGTQSCEILEYTLPNSQQFTVAENPVVEAKSLVIGHYKVLTVAFDYKLLFLCNLLMFF